MSYANGKLILPENVLAEVQKYFSDGLLYIPSQDAERVKWGTGTSTKQRLQRRNQEIRQMKSQGASIGELMEKYHLAYDTIKKIIYS